MLQVPLSEASSFKLNRQDDDGFELMQARLKSYKRAAEGQQKNNIVFVRHGTKVCKHMNLLSTYGTQGVVIKSVCNNQGRF